MLHLHSSLGLLMHFDSPRVREIVILKPQWLLNLMTSVLCQRQIEEKKRAAQDTVPEWRRLQSQGRLDVKLLPEIWPHLAAAQRDELLGYMNLFDLCCELPCEAGIYAVPSLLPACTEAAWVETNADISATIRFIHEDGEWGEARGFLPQSLFFSLMMQLVAFARDSKQAMKHLYSDRVCFFDGLCFMLRAKLDECRMHITVQGDSNEPTKPGAVANRICGCLDDGLAKHYGVRFRLEVKCSATPNCGGIVAVNDAARCDICRKSQQTVVAPWMAEHAEAVAAKATTVAAVTKSAFRLETPVFSTIPMEQRQYDFFLNHCQASGQDQCRTLAMELRAAGASVWYDMQVCLYSSGA
jgi:hypothetical protein